MVGSSRPDFSSDMNIHQTIADWLTQVQQNCAPTARPFVTLSYAQSLDGSIALQEREPLLLSGPESMRLTHQLRSLHDGILVGIGTVLADDPQLTVRHWPGSNPQPIVLDSQCRIPEGARLCRNLEKSCWVLTTRTAGWQHLEGVEVCSMQADPQGRVSLNHALEFLGERGIKHLMVEGGAQVITAFIKAQLVDALVVTITPQFVGGYKAVQDLQLQSHAGLYKIHPFHSARLEDDLILWGRVSYGEAA